jgi:hypothetical protein
MSVYRPGHENSYEKNGLRTYGDDEGHDHEPPVLYPIQCAKAENNSTIDFAQLHEPGLPWLLWTGSNIPPCLFGMLPRVTLKRMGLFINRGLPSLSYTKT